MRLIDADALIPMMKYATTDSDIGVFPIKIGFDAIVKVINAQPTIEPQPEISLDESCTDCPLYDKDRHSCPRFNKVIPETLRELQSAQSEQKLWKERYEDLLEYFHGEDIILKDRKEFKAWLERCLWHVRECDKLARQLEAQTEIIRCRECQHWKQGELVGKCGLLDCYADADCYCAWAVRERRQDEQTD